MTNCFKRKRRIGSRDKKGGIAKRWKLLSDKKNWEGPLDPLDLDLRRYIIHYGSMAQATYDSFNSEKASKYSDSSRYAKNDLFSKAAIDKGNLFKYRVTKYFCATSSAQVPNAFIVTSWGTEAWSKESNWMGYVAVATDGRKTGTRSKGYLIAWRGTVLGEVGRLVELYKNEEISITITGHSLGAAVSTLNAVDIAVTGYNRPWAMPNIACPVTAFVFASPPVGDNNFLDFFLTLENLHIPRPRNARHIVPTYCLIDYVVEDGEELAIDREESGYLKLGNSSSRHSLENSFAWSCRNGKGFKLKVKHDITLVNKHMDGLKDEYCVPVSSWCEKNKGRMQQADGPWELIAHEHNDF